MLRHPLAIPLSLFAVGLALRALTWLLIPFPAYPDASYYAVAARQLAGGEWSMPFLWSFSETGGVIPAAASLPVPAFAHWMPLASLVQVPFVWLLGPTDLAASLPFWFIAAALGPLTYALARDLGLERRAAGFAGALGLIPAGGAAFLSQPDNFGLFALLATLSLWAGLRTVRSVTAGPVGLRGSRLAAAAAAGAGSALCVLSRSDGVLVGLTVGLLLLGTLLGDWRAGRAARVTPLTLLAFVVVGAAVFAPWLLRQFAIFGTFSPSAAGGRILWIRDYNEQFGADGALGPEYLFSWGWGNLAASRLAAAGVVVRLVALNLFGLVLIAPFLAGVRCLGRAALPWVVHAALFAAWSILVAAPHLDRGNFMHSALAFTPIISIGVAAGLPRLIALVARRLPSWDAESGLRRWQLVLTGIVLVLVLGTTAIFIGSHRPLYVADVSAGNWLREHAAPGDVVMSADPGRVFVTTGLSGIQTPTSDMDTVRRAAAAYGADWLILSPKAIAPAFVPVLEDDARPGWIGPAVLHVAGPDGVDLAVIYPLELD